MGRLRRDGTAKVFISADGFDGGGGSGEDTNLESRCNGECPNQRRESGSYASAGQAPTDPKGLMVLSAKTNGLAGLNGHAWHLKANYQTFDADGKPEQAGIYEE